MYAYLCNNGPAGEGVRRGTHSAWCWSFRFFLKWHKNRRISISFGGNSIRQWLIQGLRRRWRFGMSTGHRNMPLCSGESRWDHLLPRMYAVLESRLGVIQAWFWINWNSLNWLYIHKRSWIFLISRFSFRLYLDSRTPLSVRKILNRGRLNMHEIFWPFRIETFWNWICV